MFDTIRNMAIATKEAYKIAHDLRIQNKQNKLQAEIEVMENKKYFNHASIPSSELSNEIQEVKQEVKQEVLTQKLQKSVSAFIGKVETKQNRLAITNLAKKQDVEVIITSTAGKDNILHQAKTQNADKFNEFLSNNKNKLNSYGVRYVPYQRKYNQGGKTL